MLFASGTLDTMFTRVEDIFGAADSPPQRSLEQMRAAVEAIEAPVLVHEPSGHLLFSNLAASEFLGFSPSEFQALPPFGWIGPDSTVGAAGRLEAILHGGGLDFESTARHRDGSVISTAVSARRFNTDRGPVVVALIEDRSQRPSAEPRAAGDVDRLTGLASRQAFAERLRELVTSLRDQRSSSLLVACIDLEGLRAVNSERGRQVGDEVLAKVAARLAEKVSAGGLLGRIGGDDFGVVVETDADTDVVQRHAEAWLSAVREPIQVEGGAAVELDGNVGIAVLDPEFDSARSLTIKAEVAMHEAARGVRSWLVYGEHMGAVPSDE